MSETDISTAAVEAHAKRLRGFGHSGTHGILPVTLALLADRDRLAAEVARLKEAVIDAESTLEAWFDRRELGHEAVDQAVIDAASGYLRTSRVGGMPQEESDLILGVMQNMARLGMFADLFARAAHAAGRESEA